MDGRNGRDKGEDKIQKYSGDPDDGKAQEEEDKDVECFNYNNIKVFLINQTFQ